MAIHQIAFETGQLFLLLSSVWGSPKSLGFINWGPLVSVQNFMAIYPRVPEIFRSGSKWWPDWHCHPQSFLAEIQNPLCRSTYLSFICLFLLILQMSFKTVHLSLLFPAECWNTQTPTGWPHRISALCLGRPWCARSGTTATWRWIWFTRTRQWSSSSASLTTSLEREAPLDLFGQGGLMGVVFGVQKAPPDQTKAQVVQHLSSLPVDSYGVKWISHQKIIMG